MNELLRKIYVIYVIIVSLSVPLEFPELRNAFRKLSVIGATPVPGVGTGLRGSTATPDHVMCFIL